MEDSKIVQLYWDRNELAITATSEKYGHYCTSISRNILGNAQDAEECVNDMYIHAWNAMPPHRPNVLSAFLGKIIRNISYNRYKYNTADKRGNGELPLVLDELSELVSGKSSVEQELDEQELILMLNTFLGKLTPKKRNIFIRRYWYTESVSEIAALYGMKENAVSMVLRRLRLSLYQYLTEKGVEL